MDNTRLHVAKLTRSKIHDLGWEILPHPPYSPDLDPSDYYLFRTFNNDIEGQQFDSDGALKTWLTNFFASKPKVFYERGILVTCALMLVPIVLLDVTKADHDNSKMYFFVYHILVLIAGIVACVFLFGGSIDGKEDRQPLLDDDQLAQKEDDDQEEAKTPTEILDRNLLTFGTIGFFSYASIGLVHSAYLIPTAYSTIFVYGSVATDVFSMIQGFVQTTVILHCDMVKNKFGFVAGLMLWLVNFLMFSLDLFDASALGIYANPVPKGSNEMWTMLVRGLGLFVVFYRFHSLAIISDHIEHHLRWKQTLGYQPNPLLCK